ncbi:MAG: hypothetical protein JOZ90_15680 [Alphaproteobacteria bacterium]|nr:hypothetical protein [Alphaproteobacteria bacterium]MBV9371739.1 hypothetical protein [Alphaproteobacteria bacterium]MBV9902515.1 hypothetical protein [Alphaproteobacteria bacterium]
MHHLAQFQRALGALVLLGSATTAGSAATPVPAYQGLARVTVTCLVQTGGGVDHGSLQARLCGRVKALAAKGAPVPVEILAPGDPALLAPESLALLAHFNVERSARGPLLAFSLRPYRASAGADAFLFAAAPRAVPLDDDAALDAALGGALSSTLPWLSRPAGPQSVNNNQSPEGN